MLSSCLCDSTLTYLRLFPQNDLMNSNRGIPQAHNKKSILTSVNCLFRQARTIRTLSSNSPRDVWEVSKSVLNCQQLPTTIYHLCVFYHHANRNLLPGNSHTGRSVTVWKCVWLFSVWCFAWPVVSHPNSPQSSNSSRGWLGFFYKLRLYSEETWLIWDSSSFMRFCFFASGSLQLMINML